MDQLVDDTNKDRKPDPKDLDVKVKVGWVKGLNRLYFLYEAYDNYWDFSRPGLHNDIFEVVVDGDLSGGPLIERFQPTKELSERDAHFSMHGVHAQNYHIMTPPLGKDWALAWGCNSYVKNLPYANAAYDYHFQPGEAGKLTLEFWITPFDYAGCEGPQRAVESVLTENKLIGLSWAVLDYDDANSETHAFWNLSRQHTMYGNASELVAFRLMPLEPQFRKFEANWSVPGDRHGAPRRGIPRRDDGQGDLLEVDLRRRHHIRRTESDSRIREGRRLYGDAGSRRSRGKIPARKDLGRLVTVGRQAGRRLEIVLAFDSGKLLAHTGKRAGEEEPVFARSFPCGRSGRIRR